MSRQTNVIPDRDYQQVLRERRKNAKQARNQKESPNGLEGKKKLGNSRQHGTGDNSPERQ